MTRASLIKSTRLADKLKNIQQELGLSQNELLDRLGFSELLFRSNISQFEHGGQRIPSPGVLLEYARLARVDLAVLIDDKLDLPERLAACRRGREETVYPRNRLKTATSAERG